jgi:hypothetical protein
MCCMLQAQYWALFVYMVQVYWVARYGSRGFDPAATPVHPSDVSAGSGESLLSLAEAMEKDARALESCIFQVRPTI